MLFYWNIFSCCPFTSWALHCTTAGVTCDVTSVVATHIADHRVFSSWDLLHGSRKLSGLRLVPHLLGNVHSLIKSDTPRCSMFFCLFLSLGDSLGALMVRQRTAPHLDLSALSSQCQCDQTFPTAVALAISSLTLFGGRPWPILGAKADVARTSF